MRRLPPLNALRAFEAAARHLSITDAAKELAVTSGAVSQQIRLLEDHAGGPLFNRDGRNVVLTDLGGELYPILRAGFEHLQRAHRRNHSNLKASATRSGAERRSSRQRPQPETHDMRQNRSAALHQHAHLRRRVFAHP